MSSSNQKNTSSEDNTRNVYVVGSGTLNDNTSDEKEAEDNKYWADLYTGLQQWNDDSNSADYPPMPPLPAPQPLVQGNNYSLMHGKTASLLLPQVSAALPMPSLLHGNILGGNYQSMLPAFPTPLQSNISQSNTMLQPIRQHNHLTPSTGPRNKINISAFTPDKEVTAGEAIVYYLRTDRAIDVTITQQVQEAIAKLTELKKKVKEVAYSYIMKDVLLNSNGIMLPDGSQIPNRRIEDLCEVWASHPELAEPLWNILIKRYEDMGEWEIKYEKHVMDAMNLEYVEEDSMKTTLKAETKNSDGTVVKVMHRRRTNVRGNKGCIAKMLTLVKRDMIKQFNRASATTHRMILTSVNPMISVDVEGKKKYQKRNIKGSEFESNLHLKVHAKKQKVCLPLFSFLMIFVHDF